MHFKSCVLFQVASMLPTISVVISVSTLITTDQGFCDHQFHVPQYTLCCFVFSVYYLTCFLWYCLAINDQCLLPKKIHGFTYIYIYICIKGCPQGPVQFYIMPYSYPPLPPQTRETLAHYPFQLSEALASVSCDQF